MRNITGVGSFTDEDARLINANFAEVMGGFRNVFYVAPAVGSDGGDGSRDNPFLTLQRGYDACESGKDDAVVLVSDGATTGTARLAATFTWAKHATHLIGLSSGVNVSNRSRIAPVTGVAAFANFFVISANGCLFKNVEWFQGFTAGVAASICVTVTGGRNLFSGCHIAGMGSDDGADAQSATSRDLKISGTGENQFRDSTIGIDTIARTLANASVEFAGGCPRNKFLECEFLMFATAATPNFVVVSAAAGSDRFQLFRNCVFLNAIKSGAGTGITGLALLAASIGGLIALINPNCVGVLTYGYDATSDGQIYVTGPVTPANGALIGLGVAPAA
jgi:hypothetical protein